MELLIEVIKVILPAFLVVLGVWVVVRNQSAPSPVFPIERTEADPAASERIKVLLPLKLKAYERLIIFQERINPTSLVMRVHQPGMSSVQLQIELLKAVREEYEHNLSLQIYVSDAAWKLIENAKDEVTSLIKLAAERSGPSSSASELSRIMLEIDSKVSENPVRKAVNFLKSEVRAEM